MGTPTPYFHLPASDLIEILAINTNLVFEIYTLKAALSMLVIPRLFLLDTSVV